MTDDFLFEVATPLGFAVGCTRAYWTFLVLHKHPVLAGHEEQVRRALENPDEVRRSRKDPEVLLFYRGSARRWLCAVVRLENDSALLVTAYPTDAIKAGETIWIRSK